MTATTVDTHAITVPAQPTRTEAPDALITPWSGLRLPRPRRSPEVKGAPSLALIELARFGR